jgi:hypothetical protein
MSNASRADSDLEDADKTSSEDSGEDSGDESDGKSGSVGSAGEGDVSDDEREQIEKEREERLDPDNRPDNVEVDNTQRDFDVTTGSFEDHDLDDEEDTGPYNNPFEDGEAEGG